MQSPEEADASVEDLRAWLADAQVVHAADDRNYEILERDGARLKWERHAEFTSYTLTAAADAPWEPAVGAALFAHDWMITLPGRLIAACRLRVFPAGDEALCQRIVDGLDADAPSSLVADRQARIWVDCTIGEDGCTRIAVQDRGLNAGRRARLVQRLLEIETYRMTAMLGFPVARGLIVEIRPLEARLQELVARVAGSKSAERDDDEATLHELLALASEVERLSAPNAFRFGASRAYYDIVKQRLAELREERIQGHQRLSHFLARRLGPAMNTIEAVQRRLETLSGHLANTSALIRTRVDLSLQRQNRELLQSMDRRAGLQLRLQQTVEGLSVVAISYYGLGIIAYIANALAEAGVAINPGLATGLAAPAVIVGALWVVHRVHKTLSQGRQDRDCE